MIKKYKCKVCNCSFDIKPSKKYKVSVPNDIVLLNSKHKIFDAMDCPQCGCQMLIRERFNKIDEEKNAKTILTIK